MSDPITSIANGLEAADRILKRAEDGVRWIAGAVRKHRRSKARRRAEAAIRRLAAAARRGGMTSAELRTMMAESGWLIEGRKRR